LDRKQDYSWDFLRMVNMDFEVQAGIKVLRQVSHFTIKNSFCMGLEAGWRE
jgi:hypothetical protein